MNSSASTWINSLWPTLLELVLGASAVAKGGGTFEMDHLISEDASKTIVDARWQEYFNNAKTYAELELAPDLLEYTAQKDLRMWDNNVHGAILVALANRGVIQGEYFAPAALSRICTTTSAARQEMARNIVRWLGKPQIPPKKTETASTADTDATTAAEVLQTTGNLDVDEHAMETQCTMGAANPTIQYTPVWRNVKTMQVVPEGDLPVHEDAKHDWDRIFKAVRDGTAIHHLKTLEELLPRVNTLCACMCICVYLCVCVCV